MPVRFRGSSEYCSTYKWQPSYRSASFEPTSQQSVHDAGLRSDQIIVDPAITRKKAVPHRKPETKQCLTWFEPIIVPDTPPIVLSTPKPAPEPVIEKEKPVQKKDPAVTEIKKPEPAKEVSVINPAAKPLPKPVKAAEKSPKKSAASKRKTLPAKFRSLQHRIIKASHQTTYMQNYGKPQRYVPSSPLISALDIVHKSAEGVPPIRTVVQYKPKSEYSVNYQAVSPLKSHQLSTPASPAMRPKVKNIVSASLVAKSKSSPVIQPRQTTYTDNFESKKPVEEQLISAKTEAEQNRVNRDGANFDPNYSGQLHSPQAKCWDVSSAGTAPPSVVDAVDDVETVVDVTAAAVESAPAATVDKLSENPVVRKLAWGEGDDNGRVPTPRLDSIGGAIRTHHDLTTPAVGGALLTSPKKAISSESESVEQSALSPVQAEPVVTAEAEPAVPAPEPVIVPVESAPAVETAVPSIADSLDEVVSTVAKSVTSTLEGRVPTPRITMMGGAMRTHHDLTTPAKGGALLSSPKRSKLSQGTLSERCSSARSSAPSVASTVVIASAKENRKPPLPRKMELVVRAPIQGSLRNAEFQIFSRCPRPQTPLSQINALSRRSSKTAEDLLQKSKLRKDFWTAT